MRNLNIKKIPVILVLTATFFAAACGQTNPLNDRKNSSERNSPAPKDQTKTYKVTFIELGSVRCIPCQQMQAVMKSVEAKYGNEVKIDFHDVWTEAGKPYGVKYKIEAIPTQVFLDEKGTEYFRHVGFFPEEELVKVLQQKGVKAN